MPQHDIANTGERGRESGFALSGVRRIFPKTEETA